MSGFYRYRPSSYQCSLLIVTLNLFRNCKISNRILLNIIWASECFRSSIAIPGGHHIMAVPLLKRSRVTKNWIPGSGPELHGALHALQFVSFFLSDLNKFIPSLNLTRIEMSPIFRSRVAHCPCMHVQAWGSISGIRQHNLAQIVADVPLMRSWRLQRLPHNV